MLFAITNEEIDEIADIVSERSGGYVAADLKALIAEAWQIKELDKATNTSILKKNDKLYLLEIIDQASKNIGPSCLRGIISKLPDINFDDVIGYGEIKKCLTRILAFSSPAMRERVLLFNLKPPGGMYFIIICHII